MSHTPAFYTAVIAASKSIGTSNFAAIAAKISPWNGKPVAAAASYRLAAGVMTRTPLSVSVPLGPTPGGFRWSCCGELGGAEGCEESEG